MSDRTDDGLGSRTQLSSSIAHDSQRVDASNWPARHSLCRGTWFRHSSHDESTNKNRCNRQWLLADGMWPMIAARDFCNWIRIRPIRPFIRTIFRVIITVSSAPHFCPAPNQLKVVFGSLNVRHSTQWDAMTSTGSKHRLSKYPGWNAHRNWIGRNQQHFAIQWLTVNSTEKRSTTLDKSNIKSPIPTPIRFWFW